MGLSHSESRQIAERYATASYALAADKKEEQTCADALMALKDCFAQSDDLNRAVKHPVLAAEHKQKAFAAILEKLGAPGIIKDLVHTVLANHRGELIPVIADLFQTKLDAAQGVVRVHVKSAKPLDDKTQKQIENALKEGKQTIALTSEVDASLIGGLKVTYGSRQLDASIKGRLNRLAMKLKQAEAA